MTTTTVLNLIVLLVGALVGLTDAKKVSGDFQLTGAKTEHKLTTFAMSAYANGWLDVTLTSKAMYTDEQFLALHLYMDTEWPKVQKAPTCKEKIALAKKTVRVRFEYEGHDHKSGGLWKAKLATSINQEESDRVHYWYMLIDDCSLEFYNHDAAIPVLHFDLTVWNDIGGPNKSQSEMSSKPVHLIQLPADEIHMEKMLWYTLAFSGLIFLWTLYQVVSLWSSQSVHAAVFWVMTIALCDSVSRFSEIIHLRWYGMNGVGWFFVDAMACHFEAISDSLISLLLLTIASGWTLPSDVITVMLDHHEDVVDEDDMWEWSSSLIRGLRHPFGALLEFRRAGWLVLLVMASHAVLAQWGRTYDDDFDTYHDLEHLPGRVLMVLRIMLGVLFVLAVLYTRSRTDKKLKGFYALFGLLGTIWFQSLPILTFWVSHASWTAVHMRHPIISIASATLQSIFLLWLVWLVMAQPKSSPYHRVSHVQQEENLTDRLSRAATMNHHHEPPTRERRNTTTTTQRRHWQDDHSRHDNNNNNNQHHHGAHIPGQPSGAPPRVWHVGKTKIRLD